MILKENNLKASNGVDKHYLKSAQHRMTRSVPIVFLEDTIADIEQLLSGRAFETLNYIYALDEKQKWICKNPFF